MPQSMPVLKHIIDMSCICDEFAKAGPEADITNHSCTISGVSHGDMGMVTANRWDPFRSLSHTAMMQGNVCGGKGEKSQRRPYGAVCIFAVIQGLH